MDTIFELLGLLPLWYVTGLFVIPIFVYIMHIHESYQEYQKSLDKKEFNRATSIVGFFQAIEVIVTAIVVLLWPIAIPGIVLLVLFHETRDFSLVGYLLVKWDKYKNPEKYL